MKAFITKYALTKGIIEMEGKVSPTCETMFVGKSGNFGQYFHNAEWTTSLEVAKGTARAMRRKKIDSLMKQIERLQKMEF